MEPVFIAQNAPTAMIFPPACVNFPWNTQIPAKKFPCPTKKSFAVVGHSSLMKTGFNYSF